VQHSCELTQVKEFGSRTRLFGPAKDPPSTDRHDELRAQKHKEIIMKARLTFLGGVGTVTGSKYVLETPNGRILVDCGLFQGFKQLRLRNWAPLPVDPKSLDAVVLTHAHLDHSGYLPLLVKNGFSGRILCTAGTRDLCRILLPDSGHLQEKDADYANRHRYSKHRPAQPLYTQADAEKSLKHFSSVPFNDKRELATDFSVRFLPAGHILGAAIVEIQCAGMTVIFSGDLGRSGTATMLDPTPISHADYLLIESTYGNRLHEQTDPEDALTDVITRTASRGGTVLIPSFAVGRAQTLLFHLQQLKAAGRIPDLPVFLDSPMAIDASEILCEHLGEHKLTAEQCRAACRVARYVREADESKALNDNAMPKVIISASGMATGGRVLHHLKRLASDHRNTILFAGFQAGGTRGAAMVAGAKTIKIHGSYVPVRAEVANLHMLSAHADANEILAWLTHVKTPPRATFITHGEPDASDALRHRIEEELHWPCTVPEYRDEVDLI
jgi:metallo-beta-lactamase family protein